MIKLILAVNSFQNSVFLNYNREDATIEIIIMLLGAFLLGFMFRHFLGFRKKEYIIEHDESAERKEGTKSDLNLEKQIANLKAEIDRLSQVNFSSSKESTKTTATKKMSLVQSEGVDSVESDVNAKAKTTSLKKSNNSDLAKKDDLKIIEGIGPAIEKLLNNNGINSFEDLAKESVKNLEKLLDDAGPRFRVHVPETWPEQAKLLSQGKMDEFKKLTEILKGGRRV